MGYNPGYKWDKWGQRPLITGVYWGYNPLTKWDEPPSRKTKIDIPEKSERETFDWGNQNLNQILWDVLG